MVHAASLFDAQHLYGEEEIHPQEMLRWIRWERLRNCCDVAGTQTQSVPRSDGTPIKLIVCVCVYVCVYVRVCTYVCVRTCVYARVCTYVCVKLHNEP